MVRDTDSEPGNLGPNPDCHLLVHSDINSKNKSNFQLFIGQSRYHNGSWNILYLEMNVSVNTTYQIEQDTTEVMCRQKFLICALETKINS